jgi:hypothetical protein
MRVQLRIGVLLFLTMCGMEKTLNTVWSIMSRHGVALSRIDVTREGNPAVLYSFTPAGGIVRRN